MKYTGHVWSNFGIKRKTPQTYKRKNWERNYWGQWGHICNSQSHKNENLALRVKVHKDKGRSLGRNIGWHWQPQGSRCGSQKVWHQWGPEVALADPSLSITNFKNKGNPFPDPKPKNKPPASHPQPPPHALWRGSTLHWREARHTVLFTHLGQEQDCYERPKEHNSIRYTQSWARLLLDKPSTKDIWGQEAVEVIVGIGYLFEYCKLFPAIVAFLTFWEVLGSYWNPVSSERLCCWTIPTTQPRDNAPNSTHKLTLLNFNKLVAHRTEKESH